MENKKIKAVQNWLESQSIQDIQLLLGFINFYKYFIQGFSKRTTSLISILKTTKLFELSAPITSKANDEVAGGSILKQNLPTFKKTKIIKSKLTMSKSLTILSNIGAMEFLTSKSQVIFIQLRKAFIKISII